MAAGVDRISADTPEMQAGYYDELAISIRHRHRSVIGELRIEPVDGGVILRGNARTFYGKQVAQEEVLQQQLVVIANHMFVQHRPSAATPG